jgi:hypothetical protein
MKNTLTYAELSTILAALREYQREWSTDGGPQSYPPDCGCFFEDVEPLGGDEIDSLCERLNAGEIVRIEGGPFQSTRQEARTDSPSIAPKP